MEVPGKKATADQITDQLPGSEDETDLFCMACDRDGSFVSVYGYCQDCNENLCETCYKSHRKPAPCRNHILLNRFSMPKVQHFSSLLGPHDLTEHCQQHSGELIKYFCRDHDVLGCSPCITLNHRSCNVDYIPDVARNFETSKEYTELLHTLDMLRESCHRISERNEENKRDIQANRSTVKNQIRTFREEINRTLDKWETEANQQAESILNEENTNAETVKVECTDTLKEIEGLHSNVTTLEQAGRCYDLYIKVKTNEDTLNKYTQKLRQMQESNTIGTVIFEPNLTMQTMFRTEKGIGQPKLQQKAANKRPQRLHHKYSKQENYKKTHEKNEGSLEQNIPKVILKAVTATTSGKVDVKKTMFTPGCDITGIAIINSSKLAVTDCKYNNVKVVDFKQQKVISDIKLSSYPNDVVSLPEEKLAVALPEEGKIQILTASGKLCKDRPLNVETDCRGLAYNGGKLVVTFGGKSAKVKIMTLDGSVLNTITVKGWYIKAFPRYVAVDDNNQFIYVSDFVRDRIICYNWEGEVANVCKAMIKPTGMVVLTDSLLLVADYGRNTIYIVSPDLSKSMIILQEKDGIQSPQCIDFDREQCKLYVGCENKTFLSVFDLHIST